MADIDISSLRKSFEQIRDERKTHANTATRIGNAFLSLLGLVSTGAADCLSSEDDDIANGVITFLKGLKIGQEGDNYYINSDGAAQLSTLVLTGLLELAKGLKFDGDILSTLYDKASEKGFGLTKDSDGNYSMFLKNITIWGKAIFNELEIRKLSYVGGNFVFSPAGSKITNVITLTDTDRQSIIVISTTGDGAPAIQMYSGINTYNLGTYEEDGEYKSCIFYIIIYCISLQQILQR